MQKLQIVKAKIEDMLRVPVEKRDVNWHLAFNYLKGLEQAYLQQIEEEKLR